MCVFSYVRMTLTLTLIHDLDLDVVKLYLHAKNGLCRLRHSDVTCFLLRM